MAAAPYETLEERTLVLEGAEVRFVVKRSPRRRSIGLRVDQDGLVVLVPQRCGHARIDAAVRDQRRWVLDKLATWTARRVPPPLWRDGEALPYRGAHAVLCIVGATSTRQLELDLDQTPRIEVPGAGIDVEACVVAWYRARALGHLAGRVEHFSGFLGVDKPRTLLSNARNRWGSCSADGVIRLSWRLIKASDDEIDYVVAHEVAHLRHMNHGRQFWNTVAEIYPAWRAASRALDGNDLRYRTF